MSRPPSSARPQFSGAEPARLPKPSWIRAKVPAGPEYLRVVGLMRGMRLHTVCEEAQCPNLGECWGHGTATFMILGDVCTRACGFCAVRTGRPALPPDPDEPRRVADAIAALGLRHAVITSVDRDDQPDGGASSFAACVREIRLRAPSCTVELLIPDFKGDWGALGIVLASRPDILNHNVETVPRLYRTIRPGARFERSLDLLSRAAKSGLLTKSGIMVGLGEEWNEVEETLGRIRRAGTEVLTIGQYLRPSREHASVERYYTPAEFVALKALAENLGYRHVESGPLVRSSYHAEAQVPLLSTSAAR